MGLEIERKFLVKSTDYRKLASSAKVIKQGYLSTDPKATVRVRIADTSAFITVKGLTTGATRGEWEYAIPLDDAEKMLRLCTSVLCKTRYLVPEPPYVWEVDEFGGKLSGLVVAEIELPSEQATFTIPAFIGREVTGDPRYYNSSLSQSSNLPPLE